MNLCRTPPPSLKYVSGAPGYSGIQLPFQFTISRTLKMSIEPLLEKVKSNEASSVRLNSTPSVTPYTTVSLVLKANKNKHCHVYPSLKNLKPASKGCLFAFLCTGKRQVPCLLQQTLCKGDVSIELIVVVSCMMNNDEKIKKII